MLGHGSGTASGSDPIAASKRSKARGSKESNLVYMCFFVGTKKQAIDFAAQMAGIEPEWEYLEDDRFSTLFDRLSSRQTLIPV